MRLTPLMVLHARAEARKRLYDQGEFDLAEALDPLIRHAETSGLIEQVGVERVRDVLNRVFELGGGEFAL